MLLAPVFSQPKPNPLVGRWDFNIGSGAAWLGVSEKDGKLDVWFQGLTGNVRQMKDFKVADTHLTFVPSAGTTWELDAGGGKLAGFEKRPGNSISLTGVRAPELKRDTPKAWSNPEPLFNGKNLDGWEPIGDIANNHWVVEGGLLTNKDHGANLKTTRKFRDFKVHFEANCPDDANSGFYLRGRYEVQLEYEPLTKNPPERRIGSIYGRIAPKVDLPRKPGEWDSFDVTLIGRIVTVVRNGVTTIDRQEIEGLTGGALDANEAEPGPFYIQGDHTGGLKFRNLTVSIPRP